jgi:hypothetical protein
MSQLVIDHSLLSILHQAHGPTELIDPNGRSVGTFTPAPHLEEDFDMEEADRVLREEGHLCITTAELLAHLRSLGNE